MLRNGPFWMLAGAVLVSVGRFRPSLGPFWRWAVLVGSHAHIPFSPFNTKLKPVTQILLTTDCWYVVAPVVAPSGERLRGRSKYGVICR